MKKTVPIASVHITAKKVVKQAAHRSGITLFSVLAIFGSIGALVWAFSGPPEGCTPASCPQNPFKIDFTNSRIGIGLPEGDLPSTKLEVRGTIVASAGVRANGVTATGSIFAGNNIIAANQMRADSVTATGAVTGEKLVARDELCIGTDCKSAWPSASAAPVAATGQHQVGPMIWSGVIANNAVKTQNQAHTLCAAIGAGWRLPARADWEIAQSYAGGVASLKTVLGLSGEAYLSSTRMPADWTSQAGQVLGYLPNTGILAPQMCMSSDSCVTYDTAVVRCVKS